MSSESVIFELQVEKKVFEQLFQDNKHFKDSYERLVDNAALRQTVKNLETENANLRKQKSPTTEPSPNKPETFDNATNLAEELRKTKKQLARAEAENRRLDEENLRLELQAKTLTRKLRLEEERNKSNDLAHAECKLLKLKLQSVENEKKYLLEEFEKERKIISKQGRPRIAKLEENLRHLRKWVEKEGRGRENNDGDQVRFLKQQIHVLENDKSDLIEGFELERKVFQKILKANGNYDLP